MRAPRAREPRAPASRLVRSLGLWGPVAVQMAVIFTLSSIPDLKALPGGAPDWAGHGSVYALLGALLLRALAGGRREGVTLAVAVWAVGLAAAYGVTDEWHQTFVRGRSATLRDLWADIAGAAIAVAVGWAWSVATRPPGRAEVGARRKV